MQGRALAVMQVSGGSQSFNALRVLGRWMRMVTIPNQSSVAKAFEQFDEAGRMKPSSYYERVVDVVEELVNSPGSLVTAPITSPTATASVARRRLRRRSGLRRRR